MSGIKVDLHIGADRHAGIPSDLLAGILSYFWDSLAGPDLPGAVSLDAQHDLSTFRR